MIGVSTTPLHISALRKRNVWYSVKDGDWNDPTTWMSNGKKRNIAPKNSDVVYINHTVSIENTIFGRTIFIKDLFIKSLGRLKHSGANQPVISILGILENDGTIDFNSSNASLLLYQYKNRLGNYLAGTSKIEYAGLGEQAIDCSVSYFDLATSGGGIKICTGDLNVFGTLSPQTGVSGTGIDFKSFNSFVNLTGGGSIYKSGHEGLAIFAGLAKISVNSTWDFRGNGDVEFRNGWMTGNDDTYSFYTGTGNYYFTTNNQSVLRSYASIQFSTWKCNVFIAAGIELTLGNTGSFIDIILGSPAAPTNINGLSSTSKLILNNARIIQTDLTPPMTTGTYDTTIIGKTSVSLGYLINTDYNLPDIYYPNLLLLGSGKCNLTTSLIVNGNLIIGGFGYTAYLEAATYDLQVLGSLGVGSSCSFSKNGGGSLLFAGQFFPDLNSKIIWSGNPTIECRNGIKIGTNGSFLDSNFNFGSNTLTFTTNNQNIFVFYIPALKISNPVIIDDVALNIGSNGGYNSNVRFDNTINGTSNDSKLSVTTGCHVRFNNFTAPMITGKINFASDSFQSYEYAGNQDITGGIYGNLTLKTGGIKKLLDNVSVLNGYSIVAPAVLDKNGYDLTNP